ncbi:hypothetical protein K1719_030759 [Acacia pycnantha]|nr:hypothetical protein K1719_030759 [Acacia pycnantha]
MVIYGAKVWLPSMPVVKCCDTYRNSCSDKVVRSAVSGRRISIVSMVSSAAAAAIACACAYAQEPPQPETLSNIPQTLSGECPSPGDCRKQKIQRPKSRKAESCTSKCVTTCIQGGNGSPGEGPFNVRRPLVVFKQGFRTRHYCLVECTDICNLIRDGDDGP